MLAWSTYEKEMLAIVKAVRKWKSYLLGRPFVVKTDHISLKYLLDQRVSTPAQARWLSKLMGYDFRVEYKRGVTNIGADALSRQPEFSFLAVSHGEQRAGGQILQQTPPEVVLEERGSRRASIGLKAEILVKCREFLVKMRHGRRNGVPEAYGDASGE
ncbi:transposon ty3-G gag-pol polyprotein [Tanacetum coccineum]